MVYDTVSLSSSRLSITLLQPPFSSIVCVFSSAHNFTILMPIVLLVETKIFDGCVTRIQPLHIEWQTPIRYLRMASHRWFNPDPTWTFGHLTLWLDARAGHTSLKRILVSKDNTKDLIHLKEFVRSSLVTWPLLGNLPYKFLQTLIHPKIKYLKIKYEKLFSTDWKQFFCVVLSSRMSLPST
jgi:hypothetical protein